MAIVDSSSARRRASRLGIVTAVSVSALGLAITAPSPADGSRSGAAGPAARAVAASAPALAAAQPTGLPDPWPQRAQQSRSASWSVTSDLDPGRTRGYAGLCDGMLDALGSTFGGSLFRRVLPRRELLLFSDPQEYALILRTNYGEPASGLPAIAFSFTGSDVIAVSAGTPGSDADDPRGLAADLFAGVARHWMREYFQDDLAPATSRAIELFASEAMPIGDRIVPGTLREELLLAAQVIVRDGGNPGLVDLLTLDGEPWAELTGTERSDRTLLAWSFLMYCGEREPALNLLRAFLGHVSQGSRPIHALDRTTTPEELARAESAWLAWMRDASPAQFAPALVKLEALAAGLHMLAEDDVVPADLAETAAALSSRGFEWSARRFGEDITIRAADGFGLDEDLVSRRRPVYELKAPGSLDRATRAVWQDPPAAPPRVSTRWLRPVDLRINWIRDRETGSLDHVIEVGR